MSNYPKARRGDVVENLHGHQIADPYRWMEDLDSPETRQWIEAENKVTRQYLDGIPARQQIIDRLTKLWNYEKFSAPSKKGGRYFYCHNTGLQNQSVLYAVDSLDPDAKPQLILDPNTLSEDGTVALTGAAITDDARYMAYGTSASGSDWSEWRVRDLKTNQDLDDHLQWVKFSRASWLKDNSGFYYSRYDEPKHGEQFKGVNLNQKLYFHKLGDPQEKDTLIYQRPDHPEWGFGGHVTEDGRYLMISVWQGTKQENALFYRDLMAPGGPGPIVELLPDFDAQYYFFGNTGPHLYVKTTLDAPMERVIRIDLDQPDREHWKSVIPECGDVLHGVSMVGGKLTCSYLHDAHARIEIFDLDGAHVRSVELPGLGSAGGFGGRQDETETFYSFTNFTTPGTIYRYDMHTGESTFFRAPKVEFDPMRYETKQVFYPSKDGTKIPLFITYKRGLKLDGENPTLLHAYGGFNIPMTPYFGVPNVVLMEMGGVYAFACIRGGGEYGKAWHDAGRLENKQNCFDDFIAGAQWLIDNGYTRREKLGVEGSSNGGLLIGAVMTQRPDLFGACIPMVGVMDMLRFNKFTVGWAWVRDFGSPEDPKQFETLLKYSPLHNLKPGVHYPPTLVCTGDHDDRVFPAHSFKFAAELQYDQAGDAPVLNKIETKAGHGAGKPFVKIIEDCADRQAFLARTLGMDCNYE